MIFKQSPTNHTIRNVVVCCLFSGVGGGHSILLIVDKKAIPPFVRKKLVMTCVIM